MGTAVSVEGQSASVASASPAAAAAAGLAPAKPFDVVIVGFGIAGMTTLFNLLQDIKNSKQSLTSSVRIAVVEQRRWTEYTHFIPLAIEVPSVLSYVLAPLTEADKTSIDTFSVEQGFRNRVKSLGLEQTVQLQFFSGFCANLLEQTGQNLRLVSTYDQQELVLSYRFIVISSGSKYSQWTLLKPIARPISLEQRRKEVTDLRSQILSSSTEKIVVIGGGRAAIELLGSIISLNKERSRLAPNAKPLHVTLVHSRDQIAHGTKGGNLIHDFVMNRCKSNNIEVIANERVSSWTLSGGSGGSTGDGNSNSSAAVTYDVVLGSGKVLSGVHLVIPCTGCSPNTDFVSPDKKQEYIKTSPSLRLPGFNDSAYAIGDAIDFTDAQHNIREARMQGRHVAADICKRLAGATVSAITYQPDLHVGTSIVFGTNDGIFVKNGRVMSSGGFMSTLANKARVLLMSRKIDASSPFFLCK